MKKNSKPSIHATFYEDQQTERFLKISETCQEIYLYEDVNLPSPTAAQIKSNSTNVSDAIVDSSNLAVDSTLVECCEMVVEEDDHSDYIPKASSTIEYKSNLGPLRSQKTLKLNSDQSTMTEPWQMCAIPLRKGRKIDERVLVAISNISCAAKISINAARLAFKEASEFFDQNYMLEKVNQDGAQPAKKMRCLRKESLEDYKFLIPSYRKIFLFKHLMALGSEKNAAVALFQKLDNQKAVLLFDFTTRRQLKGEWPTIILEIGLEKYFSCFSFCLIYLLFIHYRNSGDWHSIRKSRCLLS